MADSKLAAQIKKSHPGNSPGWDPEEAAVELLYAAITGGLPAWDSRAFTYVNAGAADNDKALVVTYKLAGVAVATVTYTYVGTTNNVLTETLAIL